MKITEITAVILSASLLSSCANTQDQINETGANYGVEILCGVGAVSGAIVGNLIGRKLGNAAAGTAVGLALGTGGGCYAGNIWQTRSKALLAAARKANIQMTTEPALSQTSSTDKQASGLVAQVNDEGMFASSSAKLTPTGREKMQSLINVYTETKTNQHYYLVVGHTDSTGDAEFNKTLSEQRAKSVASLLRISGIRDSHIYYQGAGSSRPIATNQTSEGRARNRRVEISELSDEKALSLRVAQEQDNSRYIIYSSRTNLTVDNNPTVNDPSTDTLAKKPRLNEYHRKTEIALKTAQRSEPKTGITSHSTSVATVDFNGRPADSVESVVAQVRTEHSFSWFPTAHAAENTFMSCAADSIRISGQVKSLATGADFTAYHSYDYLPGYGGMSWANVVNHNLVVLSPVAILRDNAQVARNPTISIVTNFTGIRKEPSVIIPAIAQTYTGKDEIIYRVYPKQKGSAVTCMDIVFSAQHGKAINGQIFYPKSSATYVADYLPTN